MNPVDQILQTARAIVLDGAMATELERYGCDLNDPLWSARVLIENPELIGRVHEDYFVAGADCAITASYQATFAGFARRGLSHAEAVMLLQRSVQVARAARDSFWADPANRIGRPKPFIAASIGPYGAFLADGSEYRGNYTISAADLIAFHRERMQVLIEAGAELLACETIPCIEEARALLNVLEQFPQIHAWISFSARDEGHTCQGDPIGACAAEIAAHPQVAAIGINCTAPRYITGLIDHLHAATTKPIVVYPNSGEAYHADGNGWSGVSECAAFGGMAQEWYAHGARLIGGCCRTGPDHIREVAAWVRAD
jgi:homocysteine S-methyltransferase